MNNPITFMDVLDWTIKHLWEIILSLGIFFEITPIKINPISWLCNLIFRGLRKDINDVKTEINGRVDDLKTELKSEIDEVKSEQQGSKESINELIKSNELTEISRIRWEILEYSNSIENGQLHTRDEYRHIIDDNDRYHMLIKKYDLSNGLVNEEFDKINTHYMENKNSTALYF